MHRPNDPAPRGRLNLPRAATNRTSCTGLGYAAVVTVSLLAFALQPGRAEAPAHDAALLSLASWAAGGLADGDPPTPAVPTQPSH